MDLRRLCFKPDFRRPLQVDDIAVILIKDFLRGVELLGPILFDRPWGTQWIVGRALDNRRWGL
jgi:hypothetical protein